MRNSIKRILRMPIQSAFMIVLIMIVTIMLVIGGNLWITSTNISEIYEDTFITIGTVDQQPNSVVEFAVWDAEKKDYILLKASEYDKVMTEDDLIFPDIDYIVEPEKRFFYGSYAPEYRFVREMEYEEFAGYNDYFVVEFSPLEDCVPDESVLIHITKVLGNNEKSKLMEDLVVWFCDHYNRYPMELKSDQTYITALWHRGFVHGEHWEERNSTRTTEYYPGPINISLYTGDGVRIQDTIGDETVYVVTEDFYETEAGQRYLSMTAMRDILIQTQPVTGTNSTNILLPFYTGSAYICDGRDISEEEYKQGASVCLVPRTFAYNNELSVGDNVMTRFFFTSASLTADNGFAFNIVDQNGQILTPFEEKEYTIVGIYDLAPFMTGIGEDELFVPMNSIQNKKENIVAFSSMNSGTTSFQIENGSIDKFIEISERYDTDNLLFTFYDRGYSELQSGIRNMKNMSAIFLIMGTIAAVILMLQISHIYVTKQKKRLAIERLLGMTRQQCIRTALIGILILLLAGTVPGMAAGSVLANSINMDDMNREYYDTTYSNVGIADTENAAISEDVYQNTLAISLVMGAAVLALGIGISAWKVYSVMKEEPMYLIGNESMKI